MNRGKLPNQNSLMVCAEHLRGLKTRTLMLLCLPWQDKDILLKLIRFKTAAKKQTIPPPVIEQQADWIDQKHDTWKRACRIDNTQLCGLLKQTKCCQDWFIVCACEEIKMWDARKPWNLLSKTQLRGCKSSNYLLFHTTASTRTCGPITQQSWAANVIGLPSPTPFSCQQLRAPQQGCQRTNH